MVYHTWPRYLFATLAVAFIATSSYLLYLNWDQQDRIEMLLQERHYFSSQLASTTALLREERAMASSTIAELSSRLELTQEELDEIEDDLRDERDRNERFEDQIEDLAGTVGTLDKLSQIDEELLQKYSRVSFLNENYVPRKLTEIDERFVADSVGDEYFLEDAYDFLEDLMRDARRDDIDIVISSAYRSFDEQREIKGQHLITYGEGANQFSADQGFSEHQLGTTIDFSTEAMGGAIDERFANTEAYEWLLDNAHEYGFVISYPEGNQFYNYEPWQWRFVGTELAEDLERDDAYFYDWEQREIDEYLIDIFEE
jgi:D-alanyl-D-alanine carboxypeptidase